MWKPASRISELNIKILCSSIGTDFSHNSQGIVLQSLSSMVIFEFFSHCSTLFFRSNLKLLSIICLNFSRISICISSFLLFFLNSALIDIFSTQGKILEICLKNIHFLVILSFGWKLSYDDNLRTDLTYLRRADIYKIINIEGIRLISVNRKQEKFFCVVLFFWVLHWENE